MSEKTIVALLAFAALIPAIMLHEVAHGWAALLCGDPTAKEQGVDWLYNGYEFTFLFPKGTPQSIQDTFNNTIKELFDNNEIQEDILKLGNDPTYMSPAEASQIFQGIQEEYQAIWAETQG